MDSGIAVGVILYYGRRAYALDDLGLCIRHVAAGVSREPELDRPGGRWREHVCDGLPKGGWGRVLGSRLSSRRWHRRGRGWGPRPLSTELDFGNERHTHETTVYQRSMGMSE